MSEATGTFIWYELATTDPAGAEAFYRQVIGWETADSGLPGQAYTIVSAGPVPVGGICAPSGACDGPAKPGWVGYVGVADVDAFAARVREAGGALRHGPADIPGVGRFAVMADPHGAAFVLFKGSAEMPTAGPAGPAPGRVGWHELHAGDGPEAFRFYSGLFGWAKAEAMDMGPLGVYQIFTIDGVPAGGMMTRTPDMPAPVWLFYFNVERLDAAVDRAVRGGGRLLMGPHEVPGGSWIAQCLDPQGVLFAMVAPSR